MWRRVFWIRNYSQEEEGIVICCRKSKSKVKLSKDNKVRGMYLRINNSN